MWCWEMQVRHSLHLMFVKSSLVYDDLNNSKLWFFFKDFEWKATGREHKCGEYFDKTLFRLHGCFDYCHFCNLI